MDRFQNSLLIHFATCHHLQVVESLKRKPFGFSQTSRTIINSKVAFQQDADHPLLSQFDKVHLSF